jgi:hypothetical protein
MNHESVVAVYENLEQARLAAHILERSDFPTDQVSLITSHLEEHADLEADLQAGEDGVQNVMVGAGLGSLIGVLAGAALIAFGGTVALVVGPLAGLVAGAIGGGFLGAMEGWGVHNHRITHYESLVKAGHPLVVAHGDPLQVAEAYRLLQQTGMKELHVYSTSDDDASPPTS